MTIMTKRGVQDNVVTYEHWCDTAADMGKIDPHYITLGSTAVVLDDGQMKMYIADSNKQWKEVSEGSGATASDIKEISAKIEELRGKIQVITEKNPLSEEEVDAKLSDYAKKSEIPTTVAQLSDAADYAKAASIPTTVAGLTDATDYAKKTELPTTVASLSDAEDYAKKTDIPTTVASLSDAAQYAKKTEIPISIFNEDGSVALSTDQLTKLANALQSYLNIGG